MLLILTPRRRSTMPRANPTAIQYRNVVAAGKRPTRMAVFRNIPLLISLGFNALQELTSCYIGHISEDL